LEVALPRGALLRNGPAGEAVVHHFDDGGIGVEPFDELVSGLAVGEADIEFLPDLEWEMGDFAVACFHDGFCLLMGWLFELECFGE
jgi:hypothetical protein